MSESEIQSDESSTAEEAKDNDVYKENRLLLYVVIFITGAALIYWSFDRAPESLAWYVVREFGKGLILTVLVSAGIGWLINRQSRRLEAQHKHEEKREAKIRQLYLESQLDGLAQRIEHQTRELADSSATIEALRKASIIRLYENRRNASDDIKHALEENDVDEVRIMAISMNNFLATAERTPLYEGVEHAGELHQDRQAPHASREALGSGPHDRSALEGGSAAFGGRVPGNIGAGTAGK